jgi:hypothetical protein
MNQADGATGSGFPIDDKVDDYVNLDCNRPRGAPLDRPVTPDDAPRLEACEPVGLWAWERKVPTSPRKWRGAGLELEGVGVIGSNLLRF